MTDVLSEELPADDVSAPIIVVPGNGRITISFEDTEAINQLESLLHAVFSRRKSAERNRDSSVFQQRNVGASNVSTTVRQVLDRTEEYGSFGQIRLSRKTA